MQQVTCDPLGLLVPPLQLAADVLLTKRRHGRGHKRVLLLQRYCRVDLAVVQRVAAAAAATARARAPPAGGHEAACAAGPELKLKRAGEAAEGLRRDAELRRGGLLHLAPLGDLEELF